MPSDIWDDRHWACDSSVLMKRHPINYHCQSVQNNVKQLNYLDITNECMREKRLWAEMEQQQQRGNWGGVSGGERRVSRSLVQGNEISVTMQRSYDTQTLLLLICLHWHTHTFHSVVYPAVSSLNTHNNWFLSITLFLKSHNLFLPPPAAFGLAYILLLCKPPDHMGSGGLSRLSAPLLPPPWRTCWLRGVLGLHCLH